MSLAPRFRNDAATATLLVQAVKTHTKHVRTTYHCPEHGPRTGDAVGFGGHELKTTNCKVGVSEVKLCWLPLEKRVENKVWDTFEFTSVDLQDIDDLREMNRYDHDWD